MIHMKRSVKALTLMSWLHCGGISINASVALAYKYGERLQHCHVKQDRHAHFCACVNILHAHALYL